MVDDRSIGTGACIAEEENSDNAFLKATKRGVGGKNRLSNKKLPEQIFDLKAIFPVEISPSGSYLISGLGQKMNQSGLAVENFLFRMSGKEELFLVLRGKEEEKYFLFKGVERVGLRSCKILRQRKICCGNSFISLYFCQDESGEGLLTLLDNCSIAAVSGKGCDFAIELEGILDFKIK